MKNFSIQRFGVLLRYDIVQNLRSYVFLMLGLFLAHFFAQLSVYYFSLKGWTQLSEGKVDSVLSDAYACAWVVTLMSMVLGLSFSFANLKSKSKRIAYLMLPASNLEKYLSRVLIFTVGIVVLNVVTFFVADVARMVALLAMPAHMGVMFGEIVKKLLEDVWIICFARSSVYDIWTMFCSLASALNIYLLFLLGSALFRKFAFFKTAGIIVGGGIFLSMVVASWAMHVCITGGDVDVSVEAPLCTCFHVLCCVAWVVLSYWLFKHITVIRRKFF